MPAAGSMLHTQNKLDKTVADTALLPNASSVAVAVCLAPHYDVLTLMKKPMVTII